ncbi:hypothetical protein M422DRAFT_66276 [Sphaerobolus stellatus SS14]|nr:hypothetical protein M422DRAFT_66276 [Sphaerobolus stellatus SS14]
MQAATVPDLTDLYGAAFIGLLVTCFLSGIMTLQVHLYFQDSHQDRLPLKLLVIVVWILDMTHLVGISVFVYHYVISNWGNESIIGQSTWTLGLEEMLNTWITFTVQMFFIYRISVLIRYSRWYLSPLVLLAFVHLGFGTGGGIKSMLPQTVGHLASTRLLVTPEFSGAINDILIAATLCYFLRAQRTVVSQRLVDRLIAYTINTGLLTSFLAFIDIGLFISMPGNYIHLAFNFTIGRIYTNSLMGTLNLRRHLRKASAYHPTTSRGSKIPSTGVSSTTQFAINPNKKVFIDSLPPISSRTEQDNNSIFRTSEVSVESKPYHEEDILDTTAIEMGNIPDTRKDTHV